MLARVLLITETCSWSSAEIMIVTQHGPPQPCFSSSRVIQRTKGQRGICGLAMLCRCCMSAATVLAVCLSRGMCRNTVGGNSCLRAYSPAVVMSFSATCRQDEPSGCVVHAVGGVLGVPAMQALRMSSRVHVRTWVSSGRGATTEDEGAATLDGMRAGAGASWADPQPSAAPIPACAGRSSFACIPGQGWRVHCTWTFTLMRGVIHRSAGMQHGCPARGV